MHYEYFRSYFSGGDRAAVQARMALLDELGSFNCVDNCVESFVRGALKGADETVARLISHFPGHRCKPALAYRCAVSSLRVSWKLQAMEG